MTIGEIFDEYCQIEDAQTRLNFACENPILISSRLLPDLAAQIAKEGGAAGENRRERLAEVDWIRRSIAQSAKHYFAGSGPIERTAHQIERGEISYEAALELVSDLAFEPQLAPVYVLALVWHAQRAVTGGENLPTALLWMRLLAAACHAASAEGGVDENLTTAGLGLIQIAGIVLGPHPDGEVLHDADRLGNELVRRLEGSGDREGAADILHALGCLYSDPITSASGAGTRDIDYQIWLESLKIRLGPALAEQHIERFPLPKPKDSLDLAVGYFERALASRKGAGRGVTLKALIQTMVARASATDDVLDRDRLQELGAEALNLLDTEPYHRNSLLRIMRNLNLSVDGERAAVSDDNTPDAVYHNASTQSYDDPAAALKLLAESEALFMSSGTESHRRHRLQLMLKLIPQVHGQGATVREDVATSEAIKIFAQQVQSEGWTRTQIGAAALGTAIRSDRSNDELLGLNILNFVTNQSPEIAAYEQAIGFAYANVSVGAAVNALNAGEPKEAVRIYAKAIAPYLRLKLPSLALDILMRIADLVYRPDKDMAHTLVVELALVATEVESSLGDAGAQALQKIYQRTCASLSDQINSNVLSMLVQLAKGVRFAAMVREGPSYDWRKDETARSLLLEIEGLEQQVDLQHMFPEPDDILLLSPVRAVHAAGGADLMDRLINLQISFDQLLSDRIVESTKAGSILQPEVIQHALGERTVLLDYFLGEMESDRMAVYIMIYSADGVAAFRNVVPTKNAWYVVDRKVSQAALDALGMLTYRVRSSLQLNPESGDLHTDAKAALDSDFALLIGTPTWQYLEELRHKGKDHLCIRPYGALRYYPLQLLGPGDEDLAMRWIVTILPSLECILPRKGLTRHAPGRALGLTYQGGKPFGLVELESARSEVEAIARLFGTKPVLDADVTEPVIFDSLKTMRRIHLCAHGGHDAGAPMFQSLFVTPTNDSDGRLRAYEILGLDLRGLELVTLGVCDSGLGRFDASDNLSGLPAAFLSAGVSTLIVSLWEARDEAAEMFFVTFYRALEEGANRLDAFREAQSATRTEFPESRDWAAFSYLGRWDTGVKEFPSGLEPYLKLTPN